MQVLEGNTLQIEEVEIDTHLMGIEFFKTTAFAQNTVPFVVLPL